MEFQEAIRKYVTDSFAHLRKINEDGTPWALFAAVNFTRAFPHESLPDWLYRFGNSFGTNQYENGKVVGEYNGLTHNPAEVTANVHLTSDLIDLLERICLQGAAQLDKMPEHKLPLPIGFAQFYLNPQV